MSPIPRGQERAVTRCRACGMPRHATVCEAQLAAIFRKHGWRPFRILGRRL